MLLYENKSNFDPYINERSTFTCNAHLHKEIEICLITEGETYVTVAGKSRMAVAGDAVVAFPHQIHEYADGKSVHGHIVIVTVEELSLFSDIFGNKEPAFPVFRVPDYGYILESFLKAEKYADSECTVHSSVGKALAYAAIAEILAAADLVEQRTKSDLGAMQKILLYCDTHYSEDISLGLLEKKLGYNKYYISHIFSENMNTGFSDYMRYLRISAAKRMLRHTDKSITEIASDIGYSSIRTFNRQFFAEVGKTPTVYLNEKKNAKV